MSSYPFYDTVDSKAKGLQEKLQPNVPHYHRHRNPQNKINSLNLAIYKKDNTNMSRTQMWFITTMQFHLTFGNYCISRL